MASRAASLAPKTRPYELTVEFVVWLFRLALAPALFLLFRVDPLVDQLEQVPEAHFVVVSIAAVAGLVLAWVVARGARTHQDARVFFVALAFFGVSGIFLMHSLSTQSVLLSIGQAGFIWSPPLCFLLGALFFLLSSIRFGDRANAWIIVNQNRMLVAFLTILLGYAIIVVLFPDFVVGGLGASAGTGSADYSVSAEGGAVNELLIGMLAVSLACYALAAARYYGDYRKRPSVLMASLMTSMLLLAEADFIGAFSSTWHFSWWLYHVVMVFAFLIAGYGILIEYGKSRSVQGLFSEVFLREELARLNQGYTDAMIALINSLEARDRYTRGHSARVAQYSVLIARSLGYSESDVDRIEQAALLHDIGKLAIPDAVLNKPSKLTPEEFDLIKNHPARGCVIIHAIDSLQDKVPGIRHHHEWMNGDGYPDGLAGEAIPLDARIIAVADVYDALTSRRAYRAPLTREDAIDHLRGEVPSHLDGRCVETFLHRLATEEIVITDFTAQPPVDDLIRHAIANRTTT